MAIDDPESAKACGRELLAGELVRLRPLEDRDLTDLERWWADPAWQVFQQQTIRAEPDGPVQDQFRRGFRAMGLRRIGLEVASRNPRGRRADEKAGFQVEGVRREAVFTDGAFTDEVFMGVLRQDWEALEDACRGAEASS